MNPAIANYMIRSTIVGYYGIKNRGQYIRIKMEKQIFHGLK
jgi:hypothetical protein